MQRGYEKPKKIQEKEKEHVLKWRQKPNKSHWKMTNLPGVAGSGTIGGGS